MILKKIRKLKNSNEYEFRHLYSGRSTYSDNIAEWIICSTCKVPVQSVRRVYHKTNADKDFNICEQCFSVWLCIDKVLAKNK